jgi:hypothetical protein
MRRKRDVAARNVLVGCNLNLAGQGYQRPYSDLPNTLEELRRHSHRIDPAGSDFDLRRIRTVCKRADEQPISPRGQTAEHKTSNAVRDRRRAWRAWCIAGSGGKNPIVWKSTAGIRERADHTAEARSKRRTARQLWRRSFRTHVSRAAPRHHHHVVWIGTAASAEGERCQNESGAPRNPAQGSLAAA